MNAAKFLVMVALLAAVYFLFIASDLPAEIEFQGQTLGPREQVENNSAREFDIYSYSDRSRDHLLLFVMSTTDESPPPRELLEHYFQSFKAQGYSFQSDDERYLGSKGEEVIYMTLAPRIDSAVVYAVKSAEAPDTLRDASDIFADLRGFAFE